MENIEQPGWSNPLPNSEVTMPGRAQIRNVLTVVGLEAKAADQLLPSFAQREGEAIDTAAFGDSLALAIDSCGADETEKSSMRAKGPQILSALIPEGSRRNDAIHWFEIAIKTPASKEPEQ